MFAPFVPRVPLFCTLHTTEDNRSNDDTSKENLIDCLGVIDKYYIIINLFTLNLSLLNGYDMHHDKSITAIWCAKARDRWDKRYNELQDNFISVPLENSTKNMAVQTVQGLLRSGGVT
jgi:hypothetical protein